MNRLARLLAAAAVPLFLWCAPATGAVDLFLKIDSIKGESKDERHKDWIDLLSYSFGASNTGTFAGGGGGGAGKVSFQDFSFTKYVDASSPPLFQAVATGKHFKNAILEIVEPPVGKGESQVLRYTLDDVIVTSFFQGGGGDVPVDSFSLNFAKLKVDNLVIPVPVPIPEPSTWALMAAGLAFVAWQGRRRLRLRG